MKISQKLLTHVLNGIIGILLTVKIKKIKQLFPRKPWSSPASCSVWPPRFRRILTAVACMLINIGKTRQEKKSSFC